ncbi:MAG: bifunctional hydroxymethylpyrimidine kinase/phosphomethylpyrimidine kinase [Hyphomicrobiaceae bacterium]|nr:bifunctional hydroxymethylpyrimidine kinase/phosphomethylpyrimidine kinase [Hyphomicrobiaceae bacterium]
MAPIALTIAGSDSSGGAGIQADLKAFSALGVYGASVITALTAQNTRGVRAIHWVPGAFVRAQLDAVLEDLDVKAIKIGMVGRGDSALQIAERLTGLEGVSVILDPVMIATSGDPLLDGDAEEVMRGRLLPLADLITPNLEEAARFLGDEAAAGDEAAMLDQAKRLRALGCGAVLIKGGHGGGAEAVDILWDGETQTRLAAPRIESLNTHGTGCTLASAIAGGLAKGLPLKDACRDAKTYLGRALAQADRLDVGAGSGPVHHFHDVWDES